MDLLFIADPLESFKIKKDSTLAMMRVAQEAGHRLWFCQSCNILWKDNLVVADCRSLRITLDSSSWFELGEMESKPLHSFSAVQMRTDPPFDIEYLNTTWMLSAAKRQGAKVFNDPAAVRDHSEKLSITEFPDLIPPTLVTRELSAVEEFHRKHNDIVIKPLDGMGGMGVFRVGPDGLNLASIVETLGENGARTLMVQRFLPEIADGDKRVLLIGGEVVPFALARIPQGKEIRGNLAAGGKGVAMPLSDAEKSIAEKLAPILFQRGLFLVGLDLIGGYLTEINVTSPTCFVEITDQSQFDVPQFWLKALERVLS
ncbi:glutathione synthase [Polynucleobacter sp. QLW-P1DATA-2]|jgi:glutathione synthase|uniref:glutathione synthase n=1 Tax=unclassified Polynucleobacter TaxID=2640945 RepID=UPI0008F929B1|nr:MULTISPECIES: glutathione synthase [unclassified Polynucleobacter]OIM97655.1 glutathione synthase [Polynucleobacter sp. MWH-Tro8-2-5-gr]OIN03450.1 glutathione synthase [Polynucleobacter sp. QLW-P1DATA-2]